jgi:hypothetical protein
MKMAKAMGLNTIGTYVFWNLHEPRMGSYDFSDNNDIAAFVKIAQEKVCGLSFVPALMYVRNGNLAAIHFGYRISMDLW